jgi:hypothetical protein
MEELSIEEMTTLRGGGQSNTALVSFSKVSIAEAFDNAKNSGKTPSYDQGNLNGFNVGISQTNK